MARRRREKVKHRMQLKGLGLTLLAVLVMAASIAAPQLLLKAGDEALVQGLQTVEARGGRLDFNEQFYFAGAVQTYNNYMGYEEEQDPDPEAYSILEEVSGQLDDMARPLLEMAGFESYLSEAIDWFGGNGIEIAYYRLTDVVPYDFVYLALQTMVRDRWGYSYRESICSFVLEASSGKVIQATLNIPWDNGWGSGMTNAEWNDVMTRLLDDRMGFYIDHMEMDGNDFAWETPYLNEYMEDEYWHGYYSAHHSKARLYLEVSVNRGWFGSQRSLSLFFYATSN